MTTFSPSAPRFLVIGAGSRGHVYARAVAQVSTTAVIAAVAEPISPKRHIFGRKHIWGHSSVPAEGQSFADWRDFLRYEVLRRRRLAEGEPGVPPGVDAVFVCVRDEMHRDVVVGLAPLRLHVMCEKPMACTLADCLAMYRALCGGNIGDNADDNTGDSSSGGEMPAYGPQQVVFSTGHVLRYTPHNMLLRKLLVQDRVIGDVTSVVHTEPVGWWHFAHSYVRGNWRSSRTTAPSLLTKCCHDIDLLLWVLCSPPRPGPGSAPPHLPATITSVGRLGFFRRARKPATAGDATNCLECPLGDDPAKCKYSARHIYLDAGKQSLASGNQAWPINVVVPEIEDLPSQEAKSAAVLARLAEDYDGAMPRDEVAVRNWFGRCVFESDNDVCDEQTVTITWDDDDGTPPHRRLAKTAVFHMVAQTRDICARRSTWYGSEGELRADSRSIEVDLFATEETRQFPIGDGRDYEAEGGHGGGDRGLTGRFVDAVDRVKNAGWTVERAQEDLIGCTLEEAVRSHAAVFAAEEARVEQTVVRWDEWWAREVKGKRFD